MTIRCVSSICEVSDGDKHDMMCAELLSASHMARTRLSLKMNATHFVFVEVEMKSQISHVNLIYISVLHFTFQTQNTKGSLFTFIYELSQSSKVIHSASPRLRRQCLQKTAILGERSTRKTQKHSIWTFIIKVNWSVGHSTFIAIADTKCFKIAIWESTADKKCP